MGFTYQQLNSLVQYRTFIFREKLIDGLISVCEASYIQIDDERDVI